MGRRQLFSNPFFLAAVENSDDCVCVLSRDGTVEYANRSARAAMALRSADADQCGALWPGLWPGETGTLAADAIATAAAGRQAEFRTPCPNRHGGRPSWWDGSVSPVLDPDSNEVIGLLAKFRNVTEEVSREALLRTVIDNAPAAISVKSAEDGRFHLVNKALEDLLGYATDEMIGKTDHDLFPVDQADFFRAKDQELMAASEAMVIEREPITGADGQERMLRTRKVVIRDEGRPRYIVCLSEDITQDLASAEELRLALAASESASRAKSEFLANMSHEIRTPLNGVMGVAGALSKTTLTETQREMVSIIETSAKTLETLLSDILDLARIEAGKIDLRPEPFDLAASVNACAAIFDTTARAKGLDLVVDIAPCAISNYLGDAPRIRQILSNLLSNAVKFTARGQVRLHVDAVRDETSSQLTFEVSDTGIGFDAETRDRLFSRFEQADGSITRRFGGSGLGLSISRTLAEAMDGTLEADATPGEGARFILRLALPRCAGDLDIWSEPEPQTAALEVARALRVLVAEDHPTNRRVIELILESTGVELLCVENGAEALVATELETFDLILMDMQMPVMDGLTAIRAIRAREGSAHRGRTPIYVLTANAMPEHVAASAAAGADGHLSKPILAENLINLVVEITNGTADQASNAAA
ncbi:PAS domain-containing protein [Phenylobacterium sp. LjRoot225]|uniref:PAS domain-containing hybrid sensor histidine kinase/response regulator n=1 Tax=Phenylobacterium sp. LjRoot225 TaxID=3342285 RepID=UPI003ECCC563